MLFFMFVCTSTSRLITTPRLPDACSNDSSHDYGQPRNANGGRRHLRVFARKDMSAKDKQPKLPTEVFRTLYIYIDYIIYYISQLGTPGDGYPRNPGLRSLFITSVSSEFEFVRSMPKARSAERSEGSVLEPYQKA